METLTIGKKKQTKLDNKLDATLRKRLVIGDIHGHIEPFKTIYETEHPDDVIILGDYFDNFHGTDKEIIDCFDTILKMQKSHKHGKFILLIGNHDFHYLDLTERYSGKRKSYELLVAMKLDKLVEEHKMQYVYVDLKNKTVYSHAGIMNKWMSENRLFTFNLEDLNDIDSRKYRFTFRGGDSGYGDGPYASPIWVRPSTLEQDMFVDLAGITWTQVVGHTHSSKAKTLLPDGTWLYGANIYKSNPCSVEEDMNYPVLYVLDSLPNYYMIETIDENGFVIEREVKPTTGNLDKIVNDQIVINKEIQRNGDIEKLADICGIKLSTPI